MAAIRPCTDPCEQHEPQHEPGAFWPVLRYDGACQQLYAYRAERRSAEYSFNQLYSDAQWHLQRHDYDHAVGGRSVHTDSADVQLCGIADVHDYTDSCGASDAYPEQQRFSDESNSAELCHTARGTDDRNSDGRQWAGHGIVHASGQHGWVSDHKLYGDVRKSECQRSSQSDHGDWSEQRHFIHLYGDGKQCRRSQCTVGGIEFGNAIIGR